MSFKIENNENITNSILQNVKPSWKKMWVEILNSEKGKSTINFLDKKLKKYEDDDYILPRKKDIFNAFKFFDLNDTKLVFLGQDPYINGECINNLFVPQAMGLSFSVPNGIKVPPSLRNIYKELKNSYNEFEIPNHGNLTRWAKEENILLLNSSLTVKKGNSNSHQAKWSDLTDLVIKHISENSINVVFLLLGNNAKAKAKLIDNSKHFIVTGVHPSPLSASRGFFNSNIFKKVNIILKNSGKEEINWKI
jgi:uracil-DNA glycosylase